MLWLNFIDEIFGMILRRSMLWRKPCSPNILRLFLSSMFFFSEVELELICLLILYPFVIQLLMLTQLAAFVYNLLWYLATDDVTLTGRVFETYATAIRKQVACCAWIVEHSVQTSMTTVTRPRQHGDNHWNLHSRVKEPEIHQLVSNSFPPWRCTNTPWPC